MTGAELVHAVRRAFLEDERRDDILPRIPREKRAVYLSARRRNRARRRMLLKSAAFLNVATGYAAAGDNNISELYGLVTWLSALNAFPEWEPDPQVWAAQLRAQEQLRAQYAQRFRDIASTLAPQYAERLRTLADEIEADYLAILRLPDGTSFETCTPADLLAPELNVSNLGTRGAASVNGRGAWRGWLIRELRARLPHFEKTPKPYATMAALLTWAEVRDVTPTLVRSVLARGHT